MNRKTLEKEMRKLTHLQVTWQKRGRKAAEPFQNEAMRVSKQWLKVYNKWNALPRG